MEKVTQVIEVTFAKKNFLVCNATNCLLVTETTKLSLGELSGPP